VLLLKLLLLLLLLLLLQCIRGLQFFPHYHDIYFSV